MDHTTIRKCDELINKSPVTIIDQTKDDPTLRVYSIASKLAIAVTRQIILQRKVEPSSALWAELGSTCQTMSSFFAELHRPLPLKLDSQHQKLPEDIRKLFYQALKLVNPEFNESREFYSSGVKTSQSVFTFFAELALDLCPDDTPDELTSTFMNSYPTIFLIARTESANFVYAFQSYFGSSKKKITPSDYFSLQKTAKGKKIIFDKLKFLDFLKQNDPRSYQDIIEFKDDVIGCPATRIVKFARDKIDESTCETSNLIKEIMSRSQHGLPTMYEKLKSRN